MAAAEDDSSKVAALFPDPPSSLWKSFTPENVARFEALRRDYAHRNGLDVDAVFRIPDIPEGLADLQPPPEPEDEKWRLYGQTQSVSHALSAPTPSHVWR